MAGNCPTDPREIAKAATLRHTLPMLRALTLLTILTLPLAPVAVSAQATAALVPVPPQAAREANLPRTRWEHQPQAALWTRSALAALKAHGAGLVERVPGDIEEWCPAYAQAADKGRRAFWVGFLSALAKHESTYNAGAVGGGGRWHGLLQILPATARGYGCRAGDGAALRHGPDNLSCAIRIMAHTVPRDGVVSRGMRGVAADWGPLHSRAKREDMKRWLRAQSYCKPLRTVRPRARPAQISRMAQVTP
jgi:hypothetical protein